MGELNIAAGANRHKGGARSKKLSTRVDLTPMVDLGFLLITFFVFTTTVSEPGEIQMFMPAGETASTKISDSKVLTIIPLNGDSVFYFHGDVQKAGQQGLYGITNFSITEGIGAVIRSKQQALEAHPEFSRNDMVLIIHPADESSYQSVIDALDEAFINVVPTYFFGNVTADEMKFVGLHR
ncbi:MAG: biopolymer transporter ExbD [Chitinophagaceae bacterium]